MAEVAPFRGIRYNPRKVSHLAEVVIPPYDVISPQEQELFHRLSPYNMIHLELGKSEPGDSDANNPHTRAARDFRKWKEQEVLLGEEKPCIYFYALDFSIHGGPLQTRYGMICALRLEDFRDGGVRPHEKTFQKVKDERLGLMLACHANLSPVFALYPDPMGEVDGELRSGLEPEPVIAFTDRHGMEHRLWRVHNRDVLQKVRQILKDKEIFIADGHHRYETALNYRDIQRKRHPEAGPGAAFEYIMMYLSNMNHGGLIILPTHRLLRNLGAWAPGAFIEQAGEMFEVSRFETTPEGEAAWREGLQKAAGLRETVIGFTHGDSSAHYLLKAKREAVRSHLVEKNIPEVLHHLDVVVLDQIILKHLLGLSEAFLGSSDNIHFKHDLDEALTDVRHGSYDAAFLINPTRIDQVEGVAGKGLIMPHKSTYFYPKVGSGLVVSSLEAGEQIVW